MKRRDLSLTIALCVSLLMHGFGFFAVVREEVARLAQALHRPAIDPASLGIGLLDEKPTTALPPPDQKLPEPDFEELFGERGSKGEAVNSSNGELLMQTREAPQEQAALTPNPGHPDQSSAAGGGGAAQAHAGAPATAAPAAGATVGF